MTERSLVAERKAPRGHIDRIGSLPGVMEPGRAEEAVQAREVGEDA